MKSKTLNKGIVQGAVALSLSAILVKILGVIYKVPLSYILLDEGMGYFNAAYTIYSFFYVLCTAGVPKAVALLCTEMGEKTKGGAYYVYVKSIKAFKVIGIGVSLLFIVLAPLLVTVVGSKGAFFAMLAIAPSIVFTTLCGVIRGRMHYSYSLAPIAFSQLIEGASKLILGLGFALLASHITTDTRLIAAFSILGITVGSFLSYIYLHKKCKTLKQDEITEQSENGLGKKILKSIFKIAVPISLGASFISLSSILDIGLITRGLMSNGYTEEQAGALYGNYSTLPIPMMNLVVSVISPFSISILPILSKAYLQRDNVKFDRTINKTLSLTCMIAAPCCSAFLLYSFDILDILFSPQSSAIGFESLTSLALGTYFLCILTVLNTAHEAMHSVKISVLSLIIGCIIKLVVGFVLIKELKFGVAGAAVATTLSYIISALFSYIALRFKGVKIKTASTVAIPFIISMLAFYLMYRKTFSIGLLGKGFISFVFLMLVSLALYGIFLLIAVILKKKITKYWQF